MLTRRAVTTLLAGVAAAPWNARAADPHPAAFYNAVGPELTYWRADIGKAALTRQGSVATTFMAGLFIKELIARGDLQRCLVVCPASLAEQWQDELYRRFNLPFEILTTTS
jgi:SNF2 family DNA or RNA helicase